jgi:hypothetical protein
MTMWTHWTANYTRPANEGAQGVGAILALAPSGEICR